MFLFLIIFHLFCVFCWICCSEGASSSWTPLTVTSWPLTSGGQRSWSVFDCVCRMSVSSRTISCSSSWSRKYFRTWKQFAHFASVCVCVHWHGKMFPPMVPLALCWYSPPLHLLEELCSNAQRHTQHHITFCCLLQVFENSVLFIDFLP